MYLHKSGKTIYINILSKYYGHYVAKNGDHST